MTPSEEVRELILSRTDLLEKPCSRYNDMPDTFNPYEEIKKRGEYFGDVCWLIINGHACQTEDWYDYFKSLRPTAGCVSLLAEQCSAFAEYTDGQVFRTVRSRVTKRHMSVISRVTQYHIME